MKYIFFINVKYIKIKYLDCFSLALAINSKHKIHLEPGFLPKMVKVHPHFKKLS